MKLEYNLFYISLQCDIPRKLTCCRLGVIGGILVCLVVMLQHHGVTKPEGISLWTTCILLVILAMIVLFQDFSNTGSLPSLFYFWVLFLVSRLPQVLLLINGVDPHCTLPILTLCLATIGFVLECFPLKVKDDTSASPEDESSHASNLLYGWLDPMLWRGVKSPLSKEQVPALRDEFAVASILEGCYQKKNLESKSSKTKYISLFGADKKVEEIIDIQKNGTKQTGKNLIGTLTKAFGPNFLIAAMMKLVQDLLKFVVPQLLKGLIQFVDDYNVGSDCGSSPWIGYYFAVAIFVVGIFQAILLQAYWKMTHSVALQVRTVLFSEIYNKALSINTSARKEFTVGEIVTLMSTDAQTFKQVIPSLNKLWSMPLQIILAIYFLYQELGLSVFGGVFILILLIPFHTFMGKKSQTVNRKQMKAKGTRLRRMYELLNAIKVIKLYAWESIFENRVTMSRNTEIGFLRRNGILKAVINFVFGSAPIFVTFVSFSIYVSVDPDNVLTPEKAFVCLTLFSMLRLPMKLLPNI